MFYGYIQAINELFITSPGQQFIADSALINRTLALRSGVYPGFEGRFPSVGDLPAADKLLKFGFY